MSVVERVEAIFEEVRSKHLRVANASLSGYLDEFADRCRYIKVGLGKWPWVIRIDINVAGGGHTITEFIDVSLLASKIMSELTGMIKSMFAGDELVQAATMLLVKYISLPWDLRRELLRHIDDYLERRGFDGYKIPEEEEARIYIRKE